jgi:hypothetical protein
MSTQCDEIYRKDNYAACDNLIMPLNLRYLLTCAPQMVSNFLL